MTATRTRNPRSRLIGTASVAMLASVFATLVTASPSDAGGRVAAPIAARSYAWSPEQVRALIGAIHASRRHGLDPAAYGVAALRAELVLCDQLWNTPGSRQLDSLARAAALALANDYRRQSAGGRGRVAAAELDAALGAGRVGPWLMAMAPSGGRAS